MSVGGEDDTIANQRTTVAGAALPDGAELVAGRYRILRWLGAGGMGRVYEAFDVRSRGPADPRELGRALEVDHVVVASLRRTPLGLRAAARLISVADGFQIWARRDDCSEAEILMIAEQLGRDVAAALSARATGNHRPTDPRAVDLYLRARAELRRFWADHAQDAADLLDEVARYAPSSRSSTRASSRAAGPGPALARDPRRGRPARHPRPRGVSLGRRQLTAHPRYSTSLSSATSTSGGRAAAAASPGAPSRVNDTKAIAGRRLCSVVTNRMPSSCQPWATHSLTQASSVSSVTIDSSTNL